MVVMIKVLGFAPEDKLPVAIMLKLIAISFMFRFSRFSTKVAMAAYRRLFKTGTVPSWI